MPYLTVENFSRGTDRSRPIYAAPQGALWAGINGHITRGGDFEVRKEFALFAPLPAGTFGLQETADKLYVFGSAPAPSVPVGLAYQRLSHPTGYEMTAILSSHLFNGKIYAIAKYADGAIHHFYDGARIVDWDGAVPEAPQAKGMFARTRKRKVYSSAGSIIYHSEADDPTGWLVGTDVGAGYINIANEVSGNADVLSIGRYQDKAVFFTERAAHIWYVDVNDDLNQPTQVLESGTIAARSVLSYGDVDLFYLSQNGIRSVRARENYDTASVNDVGTPIDTHVIAWMMGLTREEVGAAVSVVEPEDNRFWMAIGSRIYVFSYFPSNKIAAWTWYEPGLAFSELVVYNRRVFARSGDKVYLYGGGDNNTYYDGDNCVLWLPFLSLGKPGSYKEFSGMDIAAIGDWRCKWYVDPQLPQGADSNSDPDEQVVHVGELSGVTYQEENIMGLSHSTHVSAHLRKVSVGYASVSKVSLYYGGSDVEQE